MIGSRLRNRRAAASIGYRVAVFPANSRKRCGTPLILESDCPAIFLRSDGPVTSDVPMTCIDKPRSFKWPGGSAVKCRNRNRCYSERETIEDARLTAGPVITPLRTTVPGPRSLL